MANDTTESFFDAPAVAIITGASRGIGRAIAIEFAKRFTNRLLLVLTGRSEKGLQETAAKIRADGTFSATQTTLRLTIGDLGDQGTIEGVIEDLFKGIDPGTYGHALLVNNAASTGDVSKYVRDWDTTAMKTIEDYLSFNVISPLLLISKFLSSFPNSKLDHLDRDSTTMRRTIVQLTSMSAVLPIECMSLYCAGKAAREMLHNVTALEEPGVRVLNYAPGPVDTAMLNHLKENTASSKTTELITKSMEIAVSPEKTASVLCDYLKQDEYESGSRIDLFNIIGFPKSE